MEHKKPVFLNTTLKLKMDDLIGKQSVRATFKLSRKAIELLCVMADQLGIKKKSLFDQLIENTSILQKIAEEAKNLGPAGAERHQKTFVISRSSLLSLNTISKQEDVSRDLLVEFSIQRLLPIFKTEVEKHKKRKKLQKEMVDYLQHGDKLLKISAQLLGKDDKLYKMIREQIAIAEKNLSAVDTMVKKGRIMEDQL